jgi:hypothetical protein
MVRNWNCRGSFARRSCSTAIPGRACFLLFRYLVFASGSYFAATFCQLPIFCIAICRFSILTASGEKRLPIFATCTPPHSHPPILHMGLARFSNCSDPRGARVTLPDTFTSPSRPLYEPCPGPHPRPVPALQQSLALRNDCVGNSVAALQVLRDHIPGLH